KIRTDTIKDVDFREFAGNKILIIGKNKKLSEEFFNHLNPDIILIRKSGLKLSEVLTKHCSNLSIVLDGSVYGKDLKRLHRNTDLQFPNLFVIKDRGAFTVDLSSHK
ncbi:MAG: hypothetical protein N4A59_14760, partial [Marinifilum sp.]|nr:hypothetical protein [Marinifilum sp.]